MEDSWRLKRGTEKLIDNKAAVEYEYGGYQIRVHFLEKNTGAVCEESD